MFYNQKNIKQNTTLLKFFGLSYILSVILFSKDLLCSGLLDESDMIDPYEESLYETFSITNEEELELVDVRNKAEAIFEDEGFITFKDLIKQSLTDLNKIYEDLLKYESFQNDFLEKLRIIVVSSTASVIENQETIKPFVDELDNLIDEKKNFEDAIAHSKKVFDRNSNSEILLEMSLVVKDLFKFEDEYPVVDPFEKFYMLLQILEKECEETKEYYKDLVTLVFNTRFTGCVKLTHLGFFFKKCNRL
jgi:hypothetical protein